MLDISAWEDWRIIRTILFPSTQSANLSAVVGILSQLPTMKELETTFNSVLNQMFAAQQCCRTVNQDVFIYGDAGKFYMRP